MNIEGINTLGALKSSGWQSVPVKKELRKNLIAKLKSGEEIFPGIIGYEKTVIPQLQNAILACHDIILLGLRGQGKSKILRLLVSLLDEYSPIISGSEINDNPYVPLSKFGKNQVQKLGDETPVTWIHRSQRYSEKLATPDTSVADLIGDIDPIKAATKKLALADEEVINYGLIPRTNRGIFAINELPDLQPRIQVALLNIMQERDIQIRGFNVRIPLDVMMVYSANPEDYTNRGNIITPLKDRIDAQIITHYPKTLDAGIKITSQEAWQERDQDCEVFVPDFVREIVEEMAFEARNSEFIDQKSGVSTRMTITALEQIISAAERRAIFLNSPRATVRISDVFYAVPALTGKLELVYEGEQEGAVRVAKLIIGKAINKTFKRYFPDPQQKKTQAGSVYSAIINWFAAGNEIALPDNLTDENYMSRLEEVPDLRQLVETKVHPSSAEMYAWMDLILEALHQNSMLSKDDLDDSRSFKDMVGSMLGSIGTDEDDFEV